MSVWAYTNGSWQCDHAPAHATATGNRLLLEHGAGPPVQYTAGGIAVAHIIIRDDLRSIIIVVPGQPPYRGTRTGPGPYSWQPSPPGEWGATTITTAPTARINYDALVFGIGVVLAAQGGRGERLRLTWDGAGAFINGVAADPWLVKDHLTALFLAVFVARAGGSRFARSLGLATWSGVWAWDKLLANGGLDLFGIWQAFRSKENLCHIAYCANALEEFTLHARPTELQFLVANVSDCYPNVHGALQPHALALFVKAQDIILASNAEMQGLLTPILSRGVNRMFTTNDAHDHVRGIPELAPLHGAAGAPPPAPSRPTWPARRAAVDRLIKLYGPDKVREALGPVVAGGDDLAFAPATTHSGAAALADIQAELCRAMELPAPAVDHFSQGAKSPEALRWDLDQAGRAKAGLAAVQQVQVGRPQRLRGSQVHLPSLRGIVDDEEEGGG
jgi:hypothetical protein